MLGAGPGDRHQRAARRRQGGHPDVQHAAVPAGPPALRLPAHAVVPRHQRRGQRFRDLRLQVEAAYLHRPLLPLRVLPAALRQGHGPGDPAFRLLPEGQPVPRHLDRRQPDELADRDPMAAARRLLPDRRLVPGQPPRLLPALRRRLRHDHDGHHGEQPESVRLHAVRPDLQHVGRLLERAVLHEPRARRADELLQRRPGGALRPGAARRLDGPARRGPAGTLAHRARWAGPGAASAAGSR